MNHKYEITESLGCIKFDMTVNGKQLNDLSENEIKEIVDYLLPKIKEGFKNKEIDLSSIMGVVPSADEYTKGPCGHCGDLTDMAIWRI